MLTLTFGTPEEIQATADRIRTLHDHVNGTLDRPLGVFPAGHTYTAQKLWSNANAACISANGLFASSFE